MKKNELYFVRNDNLKSSTQCRKRLKDNAKSVMKILEKMEVVK